MNEHSNEEIIVSIHQPNFFPWLGFFQKIIRSDIFMLLDHVENNPRSSLWTKRVQIISNGRPYWLTIPLIRSKEYNFQPINKMRISEIIKPEKHLKTIKQNYQNAPFFCDIFFLIENFYLSNNPLISERNIEFIELVCEKLSIKTERIKSSELSPQLSSTDLLIELIKKVKGTKYLYGGLGESYQESDKFAKKHIELIPQNFKHPTYPQLNTKEFIKGLSILDALMNIGFEGVKELLNQQVIEKKERRI